MDRSVNWGGLCGDSVCGAITRETAIISNLVVVMHDPPLTVPNFKPTKHNSRNNNQTHS